MPTGPLAPSIEEEVAPHTAAFYRRALRLLALPLAVLALHPQEPSIRPLPPALRDTLEARSWQPGCPIRRPFSTVC